jgi:hypothetical protein
MQGYAPAAPLATGVGYEFSQQENLTIRSTARYARLWGIFSVASGVLLLIVAVLFLTVLAGASVKIANAPAKVGPFVSLAAAPSGIVNIVCGFFYLGSAGSLSDVVETQGNDVPLLMRALDKLKLAFMIEAVVSILAFVVGFAAGAAGVGR